MIRPNVKRTLEVAVLLLLILALAVASGMLLNEVLRIFAHEVATHVSATACK